MTNTTHCPTHVSPAETAGREPLADCGLISILNVKNLILLTLAALLVTLLVTRAIRHAADVPATAPAGTNELAGLTPWPPAPPMPL